METDWERYLPPEERQQEEPWERYTKPPKPERRWNQLNPSDYPGGLPQVLAAEEQRRQTSTQERAATEQSAVQSYLSENVEGAVFDPESSFDMDVPGFFSQMDLARNPRFEDMRKKFKDKYPTGDIIRVPIEGGGQVTVARQSPDDAFREMSGVPTLLGGQGLFSEQMLGSAIGGTAFAAMFKLPSSSVWGAGLGAGMGEIAQRYIEAERGYEDFNNSIAGTRAVREGTFSLMTDFATRGLLRRLGISPSAAKEVADMERATRLRRQMAERGVELPPLMRGQMGGTLKRKWLAQAGEIEFRGDDPGVVQRGVEDQMRGIYDSFKSFADEIDPNILSDDTLEIIIGQQRAELARDLTTVNLSRADAGTSIRAGMERWKETTEALKNRSYADAEALAQGVTFNITDAQRLVSRYRRGVLGRGSPVEVETNVLGPSGQPLTKTEIPTVRIPEGRNSELREVMQAIAELDPNVATYAAQGGADSGLTQIARLRTRLFDLRQSDDATVRQQANELWNSLTSSMESPQNASQEFLDVFRQARDLHTHQEAVLDTTFAGLALARNRRTAYDIAQHYARPGKGEELDNLRRILAPEDWKEVQEGMRANFISDDVYADPSGALRRLDNWRRDDMSGLRLFMTETQEKDIRRYLQGQRQLNSDPVQAVLRRRMDSSERAVQLVRNQTRGEVDAFIKASPDPEEARRTLLRGIYKDILDQSTVETTTRGVAIDPNLLEKQIKDWKDMDSIRGLFKEEDWTFIRDIERYAMRIQSASDAGGQIQAGAVRAQATRAAANVAEGRFGIIYRGLVKPIISSNIAADYLTLPATRRLFQESAGVDTLVRRTAMASQLMLRHYGFEELPVQEEEQQ